MGTAAAELVARVRSNINEPLANEEQQREDGEILQWLEDAQHDYVAKIPPDAVPELVYTSTFSGANWTIPDDYVKLLQVEVNHTISGSTTRVDVATVLSIDGKYLTLRWPTLVGAWAQFTQSVITVGPQPIGGTVTYQGKPASLIDCEDFSLTSEHDEPIVNYATAMALAKINDEDAERFLEAYKERVAAENKKYGVVLDVERTP